MPTSRGSVQDEPGVGGQPDRRERHVEARRVGDDPEVAGERERRAGAGRDPLTAATTGFGIVASVVAIGV